MRITLRSAARLRTKAHRIIHARKIYLSIRDGSSSDWPAIWEAVPQRRRGTRVYQPVHRALDRRKNPVTD